MLIMIVFTIPILIIYKVIAAEHNHEGGSSSFASSLTLGSMGESTSMCTSQLMFMKDKDVRLTCNEGAISEPKYIGLIPLNPG